MGDFENSRKRKGLFRRTAPEGSIQPWLMEAKLRRRLYTWLDSVGIVRSCEETSLNRFQIREVMQDLLIELTATELRQVWNSLEEKGEAKTIALIYKLKGGVS